MHYVGANLGQSNQAELRQDCAVEATHQLSMFLLACTVSGFAISASLLLPQALPAHVSTNMHAIKLSSYSLTLLLHKLTSAMQYWTLFPSSYRVRTWSAVTGA